MGLYDLLRGKEVPIRSSPNFHRLGEEFIVRDKKVRKALEKEKGCQLFGSYLEFTEFCTPIIERELKFKKFKGL